MYIQYFPSVVQGIVLAAEAYDTSFDLAWGLLFALWLCQKHFSSKEPMIVTH